MQVRKYYFYFAKGKKHSASRYADCIFVSDGKSRHGNVLVPLGYTPEVSQASAVPC